MKVSMPLVCLTAAVLTGCSGTYTALEAGTAAAAQAVPVEVVGSGRFAYRFTLVDPHSGLPWANHPYALATSRKHPYDLPFVSDEKDVYQGVSDADGRTAIFRLPVRLPDDAWDLRERFGSGPNGEFFNLVDAVSNKPLANFPYLLVICSSPLQFHRGYSYANGDTAYAASPKVETIKLYVDGAMGQADQPTSCDDDDD